MNSSTPLTQTLSECFHRYFFLLCFLTLFAIPFVIHTYNFEPIDDAKRHVAKAISGKAWPEILVMNDTFQTLDHNQGWHSLLGVVYDQGVSKENLLLMCTIGLFLVLMLTGLVIFRVAPEWWILSVFLSLFYIYPIRWVLGRPYLFSATSLLLLLYLWRSPREGNLKKYGVTVALVGLAGWLHGAWYLFALFPLSLLFAGRVKQSVQAGFCWLGGSLLAGILVGNPYHYLVLQVLQSLESTGNTPLTRLLVWEFQPVIQYPPILILVIGAALAAHKGKAKELLHAHPAFWLSLLGFILGMKNGRFWFDWGTIALLYWVADTGRILTEEKPLSVPFRALACLALYIGLTADTGSRWSNSDFNDPLSLEDPVQNEWLPDDGGILYSDSMSLFYDTFYSNPHANWRYILGFEPVLMPEDDLEIYRQIQFYNRRDDGLFSPWVEKMTPADRLILRNTKSDPPKIPELEWEYIAFNTWSGRVPTTKIHD